MAIETAIDGHFGNALAAAIDKHELSIRDVAIKSETTYEHIRKMVKGLAYPSKGLLKEICKLLKLDYREMQHLVNKDKMERKFGQSFHSVMGHASGRIADYEQLVEHLTEDQHEGFVIQMAAVVKANRSKAKKQ